MSLRPATTIIPGQDLAGQHKHRIDKQTSGLDTVRGDETCNRYRTGVLREGRRDRLFPHRTRLSSGLQLTTGPCRSIGHKRNDLGGHALDLLGRQLGEHRKGETFVGACSATGKLPLP